MKHLIDTNTCVQAAEGAYKVFEQSLSDLLLTEAGCSSPEACFILTWVEDSTQARLTHSSVFYPVSWKNVVGLSDPQLSVRALPLPKCKGGNN